MTQLLPRQKHLEASSASPRADQAKRDKREFSLAKPSFASGRITTRLLIAIDTSGSVGSEELGRYFRIVTTFFKYGIQEIDVLMFDHEVQGEPITFTEAKKNIQEFKVRGRGGTNFQAPVNYVKEHPNYDGLIIITDGFAPIPEVPPFLRTKLLWVIDNEQSYKLRYESLRKTGRVCLMEL